MKTIKEAQKNSASVQKAQEEKKQISAVVAEKAPEVQAEKESILAFLDKHKPEAPKSAESRIERMKQFEALSGRYNHLKAKDNELKTFQAGNDKLGAKVSFKNAQGFEFSVQNSNVIEKLIEAGTKELAILLSEAENEVLTFEI